MDTPASGRPSELDDRDKLARAIAQDGIRSTAKRLGVSRGTIERRCDLFGIARPQVGRSRGRGLALAPAHGQGDPTGSVTLTGTAALLLERFRRESRAGGPAPTEEMLAERLRAAHEAKANGDQLAYEDALLSIASAAALVHQHQRRLRSAA